MRAMLTRAGCDLQDRTLRWHDTQKSVAHNVLVPPYRRRKAATVFRRIPLFKRQWLTRPRLLIGRVFICHGSDIYGLASWLETIPQDRFQDFAIRVAWQWFILELDLHRHFERCDLIANVGAELILTDAHIGL